MPVFEFPIPPFGKEICYHSNGIKFHKVQESAGSAVGHKHPPRSKPRGDRANKIKQQYCAWWLVPFYISTQGRKMKEPGMMNIYWSKIKLHGAAKQAI